ncbi:MAG: class I SAM-dependent rRNA methyltransferase [Anaerolineae bacterium]
MSGIVTIAKNREKPVRNRHPWVFSGAIERVRGARDGDMVTVVDSDGKFLGAGYFNAKSQIQVRLLTWVEEPIDEGWWRARIRQAMALRHRQFPLTSEPKGFRLINAENDFLPGLVVDVYGEYLVLQAQTLFIDQIKRDLAEILLEETQARGIYERSDIDARGREGLKTTTGMLAGEPLPETIEIVEDGRRFLVNVAAGQKTGFYLDQRPNRSLLRDLLQARSGPPARVLNLFSYTGGFGIAAQQAQGKVAGVVNVDSSAEALQQAEANSQLNGFDPASAQYIEADCFTYLREAWQQQEQFDIIVCDPPKFASSAQQVDKAARGYKDLNLHAFRLLRAGGLLLTFSCSGAISRDLFQKIVFGALADSGRDGQILAHLSAGPDHPVALTFPEGEYLKGLLVRVL